MTDHTAGFTEDRLRHWWVAIAPACTANLSVSIDLWALLQRAWSLSSSPHRLPIVLGQTYEAELATATTAPPPRKRQGSYYTPEAIAQFMVKATLGEACRDRPTVPTVLDPACGGGVFLIAAYRHFVQDYSPSCSEDCIRLLAHLFGVDIDPNAVAVTRLALGLAMMETVLGLGDQGDAGGKPRCRSGWPPVALSAPNGLTELSQTVRCGNALVHSEQPAIAPNLTPYPLQKTQFDVVLGNPPYLDSAAMVVQLPHWRAYCRDRRNEKDAALEGQRYRTAKGNWDLFCVFIERALQLCREGGWHSFVVPNKLTSAPYATETRSLLSRYRLYALRDYSRVKAFNAAVYPVAYAVQKQKADATGRFTYEVMHSLTQPSAHYRLGCDRISCHPWCLSPSPLTWVSQLQRYPKLGDIAAVVGAASVSEAYRLRPLIHEQPQPANDFQVVNSGTIDRYGHHWGRKPLRYLGDRYRCPVVSKSELAIALPKRYRQAASPKLIIAGLTRQLECIWDAGGALMAGKSTTLILLDAGQTSALGPALLGLLNSALMTAYFKAVFGGNALQGGYLRIGPPQVRSLPLPAIALVTAPETEPLRQLIYRRRSLNCLTVNSTTDCSSQLQSLDAAIDRLVYDLYEVSNLNINGA